MRLKLRLQHKGVILVAVLLALELVFVGALQHMLSEADREAKREAHSKEVMLKTNQIFQLLFDAGTSADQALKRGDQIAQNRYFSEIEKIIGEVEELKQLVKDNPEHLAVVERVQQTSNQGFKLLGKMLRLYNSYGPAAAMAAASRFNEPLKRAKAEIMDDLRNLMFKQEQVVNESPKIQAESRSKTQQILMYGLALNVVFAVFLGVFFVRGITTRLEVLVDNTNRLTRGAKLNPRLKGEDEIAHLDQVFHEMEQALAEAKLKEKANLDRIRAIVDNTMVALITLTRDGDIESVNSRTEQVFGYSNAELSGEHISMLFPKLDRDSFARNICPKAVGHIIELDAAKRGGEACPVEFTLSQYNSLEGERMLASMLDITERREVERLKQELVAVVSHDLRTPLTSLRGFLDLLARGAYGDVSEGVVKRASSAEANIDRLINLINDLLDVEKMEAGKLSMQATVVQVSPMIESSAESVRVFAEQNGIKLEAIAADAQVFADPERIVQVLVNFLSNAVKFSPSGSTVTLEAAVTGEFVEFSVTDQGIGIPPEYHQTVFEKFQQVKSANEKTKKKGTGLGLAICKAIVEQHDGSIGLRSEEGKGSCFWFRIPLVRAERTVPSS